MISRIGLLLLGLFSFPMMASAAIVNIEFTAHITATAGDGIGYQVGNLISGNYVIDTSKAEGKNIDEIDAVWYYGSIHSGMLQSNFFTGTDTDYQDLMSIYNDQQNLGDQLILNKVMHANGPVLESVSTIFNFPGLDWISNFSLDNINLLFNDASVLADSNGGFARFDMTSWVVTDSANFMLDSVKITSITTSVPEPAPVLLLIAGFVALRVRRHFFNFQFK